MNDFIKPVSLQVGGALAGVFAWLQTANEIMGLAVGLAGVISLCAATRLYIIKHQYYKKKNDEKADS